MGKKVFITGAAGFIGFHLAKYLGERGDLVIGLDNFNPYYSPQLKKERSQELKKFSIKIIEGDICDSDLLTHIIEEYQITHICHLAAQAGVRYSLTNPQAYISSNIEGFLNILELCRKYSHIPLTYASSSSVYGLNTKIPFSVTDATETQVSLYGATKKSNELMAKTYHHLFGIHVTGLRFFTVYGPWGRPDMAYYSFVQAIDQKKPIDVYNFGKLQRDFTYIDDIISGTAAAIDLEAPHEIFNLGNHRPIELGTFIEIIEQAMGKNAVKNFVPMQAGDVLTTCADISHSTARLGYQPKTPLEEGILHFVQWYREFGGRYSHA